MKCWKSRKSIETWWSSCKHQDFDALQTPFLESFDPFFHSSAIKIHKDPQTDFRHRFWPPGRGGRLPWLCPTCPEPGESGRGVQGVPKQCNGATVESTPEDFQKNGATVVMTCFAVTCNMEIAIQLRFRIFFLPKNIRIFACPKVFAAAQLTKGLMRKEKHCRKDRCTKGAIVRSPWLVAFRVWVGLVMVIS